MVYGYIYKITNLVNKKIYIGQAIDIQQRWWGHLNCAKKQVNTVLYKAIRKYGAANFIIEQIDTANTKEELNNKEIYWIRKLNSTNDEIGYNLTAGGTGGDTFSLHSLHNKQEIKNKMSHAQKRRWEQMPIEDKTRWRQKVSIANKGQVPYCKDKYVYNNGKEQRYISRENVKEYENAGWIRGSLYKHSRKTIDKIVKSRNNFYEQYPEKLKERSRKISESKKGHVVISDKQKRQISETLKKYYKNHKPYITGKHHTKETRTHMSEIKRGRVWINNGQISKQIRNEEYTEYTNNGWVDGRINVNHIKTNKNKVLVNNGIINKLIPASDLEEYISSGWNKGRIRK